MIDMIAAKRVKYPHGHGGREYQPGEPLKALSERDAKGLFVSGRAIYGKPTNKTDLPKPVTKAKEAPAEPEAPLSRSYHRRDMVAEGSQTGEDSLSPSSRRGRPRKVQTSEASEDDSE